MNDSAAVPAHPTPRKGLFQALRDTADVGLVGARHSVNTGIDDLDYVKNHIADQFPVVRSYFWNQYLRFMAWGILLFAGGGIAYSQLPAEGAYPLALTIVISAFWIPFGILVGLFLEYAYRVDAEIPFDKLREINPGRWDPLQRFVNTVITGAVFAILLGTKVFTVGVGSLVLNDFVGKQPYLSLVIGFFTGFATPYVQDLIRQVRPANKNPSTAATGRGGDGHDAQDGHRT